jgi:hypothetical protein
LKKCKTEGCNNPVWGNGLCANHKPRKPLARKSSLLSSKLDKFEDNSLKMKELFLLIWNKKSHRSEVSDLYLGEEPLTVFFHHILPKSKYPEACLDEENIILLTWQEHDQVEMDPTRYEEVNKRRELLKQKYEIV